MLTIAETIVVGKLSSPLSATYISGGALFGPRLAPPNTPVLIRMVSDALQWAVDGGAETDANLRLMANYLIFLCDFWGFEAQNIIGAGGSVSTLVPGALRPSRIDFIVNASSYFPTGSTGGSISTFIGYNLDFIRGGISQSTVDTEPSYFSWNRTTGVAFISPALAEGEVIALIPV